MKIFNLFPKAKKETPNKGLSNTKPSLFDKLSKVFLGKSTIDYEVLDQLEESLIAADVGVETTVKIIQQLEARVAKDQYLNTKAFHTLFTEALTHLFPVNNQENFTVPIQQQPYVILVVGVNGVGKTTTIGKLAAKYKQHGKKVLLGAADTFRAAAVTQIEQWGKRVGVPVVNHGMHTDPASVAYDVVKQGIDTHTDVVIIDTAGRLHNQVNLMNALTKMKRVVQKLIPEAPHEVLLVVDGSTGQNAFIQAQAFTKATQVTALAITKLDGSAKGGVIISIADQLHIPIKYIGVGEQVDDLQVFNQHDFINTLFRL